MTNDALNAIVEKVYAKLQQPRALCIGPVPANDHGFWFTDRPPYEAVLISQLTPGQLLYFRQDTVLQALMEGKPVFLLAEGIPSWGAACPAVLAAKLRSSLRQLQELGVQILSDRPVLVDVHLARQLRSAGKALPENALLTPLAKALWEELS